MSMKSSDFGPRDWGKGRTKQAFKDQCDINKILAKAQKAGGIAHALKYDKAVYGEFTGVDLLGHYQQIERARQIFADLPSEVRSEFEGDAFKFAAYASDPANIERLSQLIPAIAAPGRFFPNPIKRGGDGAGTATAPQTGAADLGGSPSPAAPESPPDAAPAAAPAPATPAPASSST